MDLASVEATNKMNSFWWEKVLNGKKLRKSDTERKQAEEVSDHSEQCFRLKLENDLSSSQKMDNLELSEIIDVQAIQPLMDNFYKLTHIPIGINDLKGNVLVSVGWQDICARFHRVHPEASRHCVESDIKLSSGVSPGEFKLYRCKNNMWDVVTPIMVGDQHVGYVFGGQFFFENDTLDYELFRSQARQYGFNEEEYIAALEKVPRLSREAVDTGMGFFMTFANMLSQLSYSNIKLAHSLEERNALVGELQKNREDLDRAQSVGNIGSWHIDVCKNEIKWSDENYRIFGISKDIPLTYETFLSKVHPDDREYVDNESKAGMVGKPYDMEHRIIVDDKIKWVREKAYHEFDTDGAVIGGFGITQDITERKQEEHRVRRYNSILKGINRIFSNVVQAKTEEELGEACLSVALEITGSQFGFIIEMGADGLLHDVAKSKLAWEQCLMCDKTGHIRLPSDYAVHGLYGSVIINEKSFFTNDPMFHPDSIGLPHGHPPITSFLGVPLILDGKTIGSIAVANRESGYSCEQQEDLEAIAPAVVQVLQRKKAEQKREQAEEALQVSEERYRSLYENSLDGIFLTRPDGTILCANPQACQMFGMTEDEIIKAGREGIVINDGKLTAALEERKLTGRMRAELRYRRKNGSTFICDTTSKLFVDADGSTNTSLIIRDISKRKKAEEALKKAHENLEKLVEERTAELEKSYDSLKESEKSLAEAQKMAHIGNWEWDIATDKAYWSEEMYRIFKRDPQKLAPSLGEYLSYIHPDDLDYYCKVNDYTRKVRTSGLDFRIFLDTGEERTLHIKSDFIYNDKNIPIRVKGIVQDITERKKAEESLANIEIIRKKEIHHRIKNNLQVISSLLDLQAEKFNNREYVKDSEIVEAFRESQDRIMAIAIIHEELHEGRGNDALNFSLYLQRLLQNLFQTYRFGNTEICLNLDLEENIFFNMDTAVPLGMIVNELVSNSLKYAFSGRKTGEIQIELFSEETRNELNKKEQLTQNCKKYTLIVSDNGAGIPKKINFENSDTLGLQLVDLLVDQLDGNIELKRDNGTEFVIKFSATQ